VLAHNLDDVRSWFREYKDFCEEIGVKKEDIYNFDEVGFWVSRILKVESFTLGVALVVNDSRVLFR